MRSVPDRLGKDHSMSRRTRIALAAVVAALSLAVAAAPATAGTLDQQQTEATSSGGVGGPTSSFGAFSRAQTFTAGLSGWLDQVDLGYAVPFNTPVPIGPLTVEIRGVSAGIPSATVLATANLLPASLPASGFAFLPVRFASPPPVVAGTQYAIVAYTGGANLYNWVGSSVDAYPAGAHFVSRASPPATWSGPFDSDRTFKTYVLVPPTTKGQCKKGGWRDFEVFKNQGDCVSWVATEGKNPPSGIPTASVGVPREKGVARGRKNL
jgi:hypothetical protein